ncbi:MAG: hypothetical protein AMXMBFR84_45690 [Candidatus Hydrogenedentota bacterium]
MNRAARDKKNQSQRTWNRPQRKPPRQGFKGFVLTILIAILLGGAAYGLYDYVDRSAYFAVKTIRVVGADTVTPEKVVETAGITTADSLLLLDTQQIRERVEALPYVKTCSVSRIFPDMVVVNVQERIPIATVMAHGHPYEIDEECFVLRRLDIRDEYPGPFITELPGLDNVEPGQQLNIAALRDALLVLSSFAYIGMSSEVSIAELAAPSENDIRMYTNELPYEIRWGRGDIVHEAERLDILWATKQGQLDCTEYLDLRFGMDLACR